MRRYQHHDLVHHHSYLAFTVQYALVIEGEQQGHGDLFHQLPQCLGVTDQLPRSLQPRQQGGQGAFERGKQIADPLGQLRQAPGQVRQVLEEEAIVGHALDNQVQKQPVVLSLQLRIGRRVEQRRQLALKALEQPQYQRLLAMEVVVEVTGADPHFIGHLHGRHVRFALVVEQLQGTFKDTVAGLHPVFLM